MSRLEIELTSERPDGTWTWRAAGAKKPKGDLDGALLPEGTAVGAVLRAEAEILVDGIEITAVLPPKGARKEPNRIELLGSGKEEPLVTTQLASKGRGGKGKGRDRDDRGERGDRRDKRDRDSKGGRGGPRERESRERDSRPAAPPQRPAPKRLRPGRKHRSAVLDELAVEERPIAEQVLRGGIPAVREQIKKQNDQAKKENRPELPEKQVVAMAEKLLPKLRRAEWRDRADAALEDLEELDLRDLRSVVVAAEDGARDEESRAIAAQLSSGLTRRVESEHAQWVEDMTENLDAGRFVRALRISSRPPKAGAPVPKALAERLVATVSEGLNSRTKQEVYVATLEALSFSPIRAQVRITSKPENPSEDLLEAVKRTSDKLPEIAAEFGVDPKEANAARRRHRSRRREEAKAAKDEARNAEAEKRRREGPKSYKPPAPEPVEEQSDVPADAGEAPSELSEATGEESPEAAASETDAPEAEAPAADASEAEASETESPEVDASEAGVADTAGEGADAAADTGETDPDAPDAGGESAEDPEKSA